MGQFYTNKGVLLLLLFMRIEFISYSHPNQMSFDKTTTENVGLIHPDHQLLKVNPVVVIAGWSFDGNSLIADQGVEANINQLV